MEEDFQEQASKPKSSASSQKRVRLRVLILAIVATMIVSVGGTLFSLRFVVQQFLVHSSAPSSEDLAEIEKVYHYLKQGYVDKGITKRQLIDGALKGMAEAVGDPYTTYLVNDETAVIDETMTGAFGGIGAELKTDQSRVTISTTMEGTPAQEVGLQTNDIIVKVDGEDMNGKSISEVVRKVRGPVGTTVVLTIERSGFEIEVPITRASIAIQSVRATLDPTISTIGHIRIISFAKNTAKEVEEAIQTLTAQGATALIIDVRHNPGGLLDQALAVANMFLQPGQPILQIEDRNGNTQIYKASDEYGTFKVTTPYVLLVDEGSASASEILAAALKDSANAKLIGTKTYGKGTVQSVVDISQNSELKFTNAKWLTPNGEWIHQKGIEPTQEVRLPEYAFLKLIDTRETVKTGEVSNNVLTIETILQGLGYSVVADGYFDSSTEQAVTAFQQSEALAVTGEVDEPTANRLMVRVRELIEKNDTQYQAAIHDLMQMKGE